MKLKPNQKKDLKQVEELLVKNDAVILAGSTGYGKTVVSWAFIKNALADPRVRILVLTHGRKEIRKNFTDSFAAEKIDYLAVEKSADVKDAKDYRVIVALPQTIKSCVDELGEFSLLVCDEAHHFYSAPMITEIIAKLNIKKHLLLTNSHYGLKMPKVFCSRETLLSRGDINDVGLCIVSTNFSPDFYEDYVGGSLKEEKELPQSLLKAIKKIISKEKTMIMTHSIKSADHLYEILAKEKYQCAVSHSDNDKACELLDEFKDSGLHVLIVVDRGNIGFDYPDLGNIIDLTFSKNIERLEQIFGRLCRKSSVELEKTYYKIVPKIYQREFKVIMSGVLALGVTEIYTSWDGRDGSLRILDSGWIFEEGDSSLEDTELKFYSKYMETFGNYCSIYYKDKDKKHALIKLSTALKRIKDRSPWITYIGCKAIAEKYESITHWRAEHRLSHNFAYYKKWLRDIAMDLGWVVDDSWLYNECLSDAGKTLSLEDWSRKYPDSYSYSAINNWLEFVAQDLDWK